MSYDIIFAIQGQVQGQTTMSRSKSAKIQHLCYVGHLCINFHNPFVNPSCFQGAELIIDIFKTFFLRNK